MSSRTLSFITTVVLTGMTAACSQPHNATAETASSSASENGAPDAAASSCSPAETRSPNARNQRPAFPAQTRACERKSNVAFDVVVLAKGLDHPWAVEPLPGGDLLITEKSGNIRIISATGAMGEPIAGVPPVLNRGQGGLLDVALSPNFSSDRTIYWSYTEPREGGNATSVARGVLSQDRKRLDQ